MNFPYRKVHFVGIGGIGMSALARVLLTLGVEVTGSDITENLNVKELRKLGANICVPHREEALKNDVELVVFSSAVPQDNVELKKARNIGIPLMKRGKLLAAITKEKRSLIVAGSHGKTTTTAMIGRILWGAGFSPTIIVGGKLKDFQNTNALIGSGELVVAESDESDGTFLHLSPYIGVLTNIDREHLNHYGSFEALKEAFRSYLGHVKGYRVVCMDDPNAYSVSLGFECLYYSLNNYKADITAENLEIKSEGTCFECVSPWGRERFFLKLPGPYNVRNALAAIATAALTGVPLERIACELEKFSGVERRLTVRGYCRGAVLIDDYAHHPTEILNTLEAVRQRWPDKRVLVVFQPHRYSRMKLLWKDFAEVLSKVEELWVTDIYSAGEKSNGFNMESFLKELKRRGISPNFFKHWRDMITPLRRRLTPEHVLITMGAGDIWKLCNFLAEESTETTP